MCKTIFKLGQYFWTRFLTFCQCSPFLISQQPKVYLEYNYLNNFKRGPPKEHSCEIILKTVYRFSRRRTFLTYGRRDVSDHKSSPCTACLGELKTSRPTCEKSVNEIKIAGPDLCISDDQPEKEMMVCPNCEDTNTSLKKTKTTLFPNKLRKTMRKTRITSFGVVNNMSNSYLKVIYPRLKRKIEPKQK